MSHLRLSGERFSAIYQLRGTGDEAAARAEDICLEQTVEFPRDLIQSRAILDQVLGRVLSLRELGPNLHEARIAFPVEVAGRELTQLLNVLMGNISLLPGIRLVGFELPESMLGDYPGPRFGVAGLRELLEIPERPLLCTALKPMGLSPLELADLAYKFALGGIDLIKDDHGLADQSFCPFRERVLRCAEAVNRANRETGRRSLYFPNISAPADRIMSRARLARSTGPVGCLISPGLTGLDAMRRIAAEEDLAMPVISHPAMQGAFTLRSRDGISHGTLYGRINRLAGADACVFPHYGGRFPFSPEECGELAEGTRCKMGTIRPIFPVPAGGMGLDRIPQILRFYGRDMILLIGGDLHRHGPDLVENCRNFARLTAG